MRHRWIQIVVLALACVSSAMAGSPGGESGSVSDSLMTAGNGAEAVPAARISGLENEIRNLREMLLQQARELDAQRATINAQQQSMEQFAAELQAAQGVKEGLGNSARKTENALLVAGAVRQGQPDLSAQMGQLEKEIADAKKSVEDRINGEQREPQAAASGKKESTYQKIWRFAEWYKSEDNPVLQNILFSGRFQYEYAALDADEGSHDEWNVRRLRLGAKSQLFRSFTLHGEVELNPQEANPLYLRFTDAYLQWSGSSRFVLTVGKQSVPFTMDGATSSKELIAIDRSNLSNNLWFPQEYIPGVSFSGKISPWVYRAGVYSAGKANREFGEFNGSLFSLAVVGYDFAKALGAKEALLAANHVYQNPDPGNTFTRQLQHIVSVNFKFDADPWGVRTDLSAASGYLGQSDLWAAMLMPFFNVTDKFQLVGRYTYIKSDDLNGVRLATYENSVVSGRGDRYNELYFGVNHYFYGHKLKLQSGLQYADMNDRARDGGDYSGLSWTTGLRVSW